jgi:hypothetical protein
MRAPRLQGVQPKTSAPAYRQLHPDALRTPALCGAQAAGFDCCADDVGLYRMRLFDVDAHYLIRPNAVEMARRAEVGLDPITDYGTLRLLASLPLGHPVPVLEIPDYESRLARTLADGAVTITDTHVIRLVCPPLSVAIAVVVDDDWQGGIRRAGRFSNFASRMLVCTADSVAEDAVAEATFYGVGLATLGDGAAVEMAAYPEPTLTPFDPVVWQFQEEVALQLQMADARCAAQRAS